MMQRCITLTLLITLVIAGSIYYYHYQPIHAPILAAETSASIIPDAVPEVPVTEPLADAPTHTALEQTPRAHTIKVTNNITQKMIGYKKAFMTYTPEFSVEINGAPLPFGQTRNIETFDHKLSITYHYNFLNGYRVGFRTLSVEFAPETTNTAITFSWKNDNHVILTGAIGYSVTAKSE